VDLSIARRLLEGEIPASLGEDERRVVRAAISGLLGNADMHQIDASDCEQRQMRVVVEVMEDLFKPGILDDSKRWQARRTAALKLLNDPEIRRELAYMAGSKLAGYFPELESDPTFQSGRIVPLPEIDAPQEEWEAYRQQQAERGRR